MSMSELKSSLLSEEIQKPILTSTYKSQTPIKKENIELDITDKDLGGSEKCKNPFMCGGMKETIEPIIPFWLDNPNIIFNNDQMFEFFPTEDMSFSQKLNAVSRTIIIMTMVSFLYTQSVRIMIIGGISLFFVYMLYLHNTSKKEIINVKKKTQEGFDDPAKEIYSTSDLMNVFKAPEAGNPFGNVLITDYIYDPKRKPAPPAYNANVAKDIVNKAKDCVRQNNPDQPDITEKLFQDLGDEYVFEQSLRQFTSMPSTTIPNDQESFMDFCYGGMTSCKEGNAFACAKNAWKYNNY
jgi:hypothetical protein